MTAKNAVDRRGEVSYPISLHSSASSAVLTNTAMTDFRLDTALGALFFGVVIGLMALGYLFMFLDFRAYLRRLRGFLVHVRAYASSIPSWATGESARPFAALGLTPPCTEEEVLQAYRELVKEMHPDLGGDRREFLRLQANFEAAMRLISEA